VPQTAVAARSSLTAGLELDVVAVEMLLRAPQRLVEPPSGRAAVTGDEAGGVEAGSCVALALQQHQADQRLRPGEEDAARAPACTCRRARLCESAGSSCPVF